MQWHWIDLTILGVIAISMLTGLFRGFIKELIALIVWFLAIWCGYHYANLLDPWLSNWIADQSGRTAVAFFIIFLSIILVGAIVNALLSFILKRAGLSGTDRLLGMGFGFLRGVFIVALIILAVRMTSLPQQQYIKDSVLFAQFNPVVDFISSKMPGVIKQVESKYPIENNMKLEVEQS